MYALSSCINVCVLCVCVCAHRYRLGTRSAPIAKRSVGLLGTQSVKQGEDNPRRARVHYQWRQQQHQMEVVQEEVRARLLIGLF